MYAKVFWLMLIACQGLLKSGQCLEAKRFFGVGARIPGDQLLVKDVLHSRPAGADEQPRVEFTYEITQPVTCVEILSEENISAEVKFSLVNRLVVGMVKLAGSNQSGDTPREEITVPPTTEFDVTIMVFGLNESAVNFDYSLVINRDQQFEGEMEPYESDEELDGGNGELFELFDNIKRDALEVDEDDDDEEEEEDEEEEDDPFADTDTDTEGPLTNMDGFDKPDKIIERGNRQPGDRLLYETYQTSPDDSDQTSNRSLVFYYIDTDSITYVKFVILNHYQHKNYSDAAYLPPVVEFSLFSPGTLKAVITDFDSQSLFVQMFIYGYRAHETPKTYVPFLPPPHWQRPTEQKEVILTPMEKMQLLLLTGQLTTPSPSHDDDEDDGPRSIRPEEMELDHDGDVELRTSSAFRLDQMDRGLGALLGLLLLILHN